MKIRKFIAGGLTALLATAGLAVLPVMAAEAHTPTINATCSGLVLNATAYDADKANTWTYTVGSVTESGTFGASLSKTIAFPQESATTTYSATIKAEDGSYLQTKSGSVGPCGVKTITLPTLGTAPATCQAPGYLVPNFTKWPAAQNANGFEGDGFRVYLNKTYTGPGTYIATLQKVGAGFDPKYPNGTKVVGATTQTLVVQSQISDEVCAGEQPANKVTTSEWVDEALTCDARAVTQHRTVTTEVYVRTGQTWVIDPTQTTVVTETNYRPKTADEVKPCIAIPDSIYTETSSEKVSCDTELVTKTTLFFQSDAIWNADTRSYDTYTEPYLINTTNVDRDATVAELDAAECPVSEQPADKVVTSEWTDGTIVCGDTSVAQTRTISTTPFKLVEREWVAGETTVVKEAQTRNLTAAEIAANACPISTEIVSAKTQTDVLAFTGAGGNVVWYFYIGIVLLCAGALAVIFKRHRSTKK